MMGSQKLNIDFVPWIFIFSSIILVSWTFGQKATFYYLLLLVSGMLVYRYDEIMDIIKPKQKQTIYYPNLNH